MHVLVIIVNCDNMHCEKLKTENKFETLVHLVGVTIEMYYDARPYERQISKSL